MDIKEKILAEIERLINEFGEQRDVNLEDLRDFINSLPEEPVSEDLENAADKYCCNICNIVEFTEGDSEEEASDREYVERAFKAGAQWQKNQLMNKAVNGLVICDEELTGGYKDIVFSVPKDLEVDDHVKMIIIKED